MQKQENITVTCNQKNKIIYQEVTVIVAATYQLPGWLEWFGIDSEYRIETEARLAAVDPDEFIRNADLVVDLITQVDSKTGGHIGKALDKITTIGDKILDWIKLD